jgi:hypothetical protein
VPQVVDVIEYDTWFAEGRTGCASTTLEAPFFNPSRYGLSDEDLPVVTLPAGYEVRGRPRACSDGGVDVIAHIYSEAAVLLIEGTSAWAVPGSDSGVSRGSVGGALAVFVEPRDLPGCCTGAMVIVSAPFGLLVVSRTKTLDEAIEIARGIDLDSIVMPRFMNK